MTSVSTTLAVTTTVDFFEKAATATATGIQDVWNLWPNTPLHNPSCLGKHVGPPYSSARLCSRLHRTASSRGRHVASLSVNQYGWRGSDAARYGCGSRDWSCSSGTPYWGWVEGKSLPVVFSFLDVIPRRVPVSFGCPAPGGNLRAVWRLFSCASPRLSRSLYLSPASCLLYSSLQYISTPHSDKPYSQSLR